MIVGDLAIALNLMSVAVLAFIICMVFISAITRLIIPKLDKITFADVDVLGAYNAKQSNN